MICQDMIKAYMFGWKNDHYGKVDLEIGIQYAKDLMKFEHRKKEPFYHYDLKDFINWAEIEKLKVAEKDQPPPRIIKSI